MCFSVSPSSQYPKILTTKKLKPPCIGCPCQFPCFGGDALTQQPSQYGRPVINSATPVLYALSPWSRHAWPAVLRDRSAINFQVTTFINSLHLVLVDMGFNSHSLEYRRYRWPWSREHVFQKERRFENNSSCGSILNQKTQAILATYKIAFNV